MLGGEGKVRRGTAGRRNDRLSDGGESSEGEPSPPSDPSLSGVDIIGCDAVVGSDDRSCWAADPLVVSSVLIPPINL